MSRGMVIVHTQARPMLTRTTDMHRGPWYSMYEPGPRLSHSTVLVGDKLFLWGGLQKDLPTVCDGPEKERFTSFVEVFHLRNGCWQQRKTRGKPHLGAINYSSVVIGKKIFYFGGHCGHTGCFHNNITALNTEKMMWEEIPSKGKEPMKKNSCGMVSFEDGGKEFLFLVGGVGEVPSSPPPQFKYSPWKDSSVCGRTNEQHIFSLLAGEGGHF